MTFTSSDLPNPTESRALLIGFSAYEYEPDLPAVANNLHSLADFLTSRSGWGLPAQHCHVISSASKAADIISPLRQAASAAKDTLFIYYAGHGILDEELEFFLSLPDSRLDEPWTGVPYLWLRKLLSRARSKRRIAILDSCFSGKAHGLMGDTSAAVKAQAAAAGTAVITSARDDRMALAPVGETYTAFTGELLKVLREGITDGPRIITLDQAYESVKDALTRQGRPRPDKTGSDTSGLTGLALNVAYTGEEIAEQRQVSVHKRLKYLASRLNLHASQSERPRKNSSKLSLAGGRYTAEAMIAAGGMGEIYVGQDTLLNRMVAIKAVRERSDDSRLLGYLRDEARAAASLSHPSIASVFDFVDSGTRSFMVMEFVPGMTIHQAMEEIEFTPHESLAVLTETLQAIEYSHSRGIIHCDIKPGNLVITPEGRIKVLDFGISSYSQSLHGQSGTAIGTLRYMPPESWEGAAPHETRDIFSAGAVLYELLTGQSALAPSGSYTSARYASLTKLIAPSELNPSLRPEIDNVVLRALAFNPRDRFQEAAEMRSALERLL
ncbi:Serine_threonine-protein kinase PknD [Streptomyces sp. enrichment culture]|uniref:caspase, EACC1-associated type n=1 Tax=Streptomyces sp. enrichment culture TaxID=1795815 RepID=UPI003F573293